MNDYPFSICQVVGYKNSGKTTLMNQLIADFTKRKKRVGAIKHHGHGGEPDRVLNTDSDLHMQAGACLSSVQGESVVQMTLQDENFSLRDIIALYSMLSIEHIFIEGYKDEFYPKIVLIRDEKDLDLLDSLAGIIAVGVWDEQLKAKVRNCYTFNMNELDNCLRQVVHYITVKLETAINLE